MSKTYRDKYNWAAKRSSVLLDSYSMGEWLGFWKDMPLCYSNYYKKNPSWYNRLVMQRPHRRLTRDLLRRTLCYPTSDTLEVNDELMWPLYRKPHKYYW